MLLAMIMYLEASQCLYFIFTRYLVCSRLVENIMYVIISSFGLSTPWGYYFPAILYFGRKVTILFQFFSTGQTCFILLVSYGWLSWKGTDSLSILVSVAGSRALQVSTGKGGGFLFYVPSRMFPGMRLEA